MVRKYKVKVNNNRTAWFNENDQLHREDGPAVEYEDGGKFWYLNGELHREGGPAIEYEHGSKQWYKNGKRHREDGPAVESYDGHKYWYLNDKFLTEQEFNEQIDPLNNKIVEFGGIRYKLVRQWI